MFSSTWSSSLLAYATITSFVSAQIFDPSSVALATRTQWCQAEINTCLILCSQSTNSNNCVASTLEFDCFCKANASSPGLAYYKNTIPYFVCYSIYANCIAASPNNVSANAACRATEKANCPQIDPASFGAAAADGSGSSASASASTSASSSSAQSRSSTTSSQTDSASTRQQLPKSTSTSTAASLSTSKSRPNTGTKYRHPLSTGTKIGIGVGITLGVLFLLGLGYGIYTGLRRRNAEKKRENGGYEGVPGVPGRTELGSGDARYTRTELEAPLSEAEKEELERRRRAAELDGTPRIEVAEMGDGTPGGERRELEARRAVRYEMD